VAVMNKGRVQQFDTPLNIYNQPANRFVAEFVGSPSMNFIDGRIEGGVFVSDSIKVPVNKPDGEISLGIRPEHIHVLTEPRDGAIPARVYVTELMGNETFVFLSVGGHKLIARAPADFRAEVESMVWLQLDTQKVHFFAKKKTTDYTD
jgi:multiple sugar transport system ATP-binding protein